jgi:hypothetical protein
MNPSPSTSFFREATQTVRAIALLTTFALMQLTALADTTVDLGTASNFAVLAGSKITDVAGSTTIFNGNVGLTPTTGAAIGLTSGQVFAGTIYSVNAAGPTGSVNNPGLLTIAMNDLTAAYNDAAARAFTVNLGDGDNQLGGQTLFPGVYRFGHAATANLIGTLILDANGEANPVWIFQATSDLITAAGAPGEPGSRVLLINGADACDVFWQVGSSATIGTYSAFTGHIMADQSITLGSYATLTGSAYARVAAVTLDHNVITAVNCSDEISIPPVGVPEFSHTLLLLGFGLGTLVLARKRL